MGRPRLAATGGRLRPPSRRPSTPWPSRPTGGRWPPALTAAPSTFGTFTRVRPRPSRPKSWNALGGPYTPTTRRAAFGAIQTLAHPRPGRPAPARAGLARGIARSERRGPAHRRPGPQGVSQARGRRAGAFRAGGAGPRADGEDPGRRARPGGPRATGEAARRHRTADARPVATVASRGDRGSDRDAGGFDHTRAWAGGAAGALFTTEAAAAAKRLAARAK